MSHPTVASEAANTASTSRSGRLKSFIARLGGSSSSLNHAQQSPKQQTPPLKPLASSARLSGSRKTDKPDGKAGNAAIRVNALHVQEHRGTVSAAKKSGNASASSAQKHPLRNTSNVSTSTSLAQIEGDKGPTSASAAAEAQAKARAASGGRGRLSFKEEPRNWNDNTEYTDDEPDGADADASMRPLTPSSIDASSSFTGSMSANSLAPTSRTFKSFVTGHSKTSDLTKPLTQASTNGNVTAHAEVATAATPNSIDKGKMRATAGDEQSAAPLAATSNRSQMSQGNRIATSLHESSGILPTAGLDARTTNTGQSSSIVAPLPDQLERSAASRPPAISSPLRNSYVGLEQSALHVLTNSTVTSNNTETSDVRDLRTGDRATRRDDDNHSILHPSSGSITYSRLPDGAASIRSHYTSASPLSTAIPLGIVDDDSEDLQYHYPRYSVQHPKNNPRASSPPPDNASVLTLASSTGGHANSIYQNAVGAATPTILGSSAGPPHSGPFMSSRYASYTDGLQYLPGNRSGAAEDASIRAIPPSRRDSVSSSGSRWSAAVLSSKGQNQGGANSVIDKDESFMDPYKTSELSPDRDSKHRSPSLRTCNSYVHSQPAVSVG